MLFIDDIFENMCKIYEIIKKIKINLHIIIEIINGLSRERVK